MKTIQVNTTRPALEITRDGETTRWEYDILTVKLAMDELQEKLKLDTKKPVPTSEYLASLATALDAMGLVGCTVDLALRMHSLVSVQFAQLATSIAQQVAELDE